MSRVLVLPAQNVLLSETRRYIMHASLRNVKTCKLLSLSLESNPLFFFFNERMKNAKGQCYFEPFPPRSMLILNRTHSLIGSQICLGGFMGISGLWSHAVGHTSSTFLAHSSK